MSAYPVMKANGWNIQSVTQLPGTPGTYLNSQNSTAPVVPAGVLLSNSTSVSGSPTSSLGYVISNLESLLSDPIDPYRSTTATSSTAASVAASGTAGTSNKSAGTGMSWARGEKAKWVISGLLLALGILA
jgi:hypothetical protein